MAFVYRKTKGRSARKNQKKESVTGLLRRPGLTSQCSYLIEFSILNSPNHILFAYGTLLDEKVQKKLFGTNLKSLHKARLHGWKIHTHEEYPFIAPEEGYIVEGILVELSTRELLIADEWEETPHVYRRELLEIQRIDGINMNAWVYTRRQI
jgi:gamma-glutamylcyclotransferase (GGCT)/AIG2-like uncharacterized protein YtfP